MKDSATREPLRGAHGCATADTCVGDPGCETYPRSEACQAESAGTGERDQTTGGTT